MLGLAPLSGLSATSSRTTKFFFSIVEFWQRESGGLPDKSSRQSISDHHAFCFVRIYDNPVNEGDCVDLRGNKDFRSADRQPIDGLVLGRRSSSG